MNSDRDITSKLSHLLPDYDQMLALYANNQQSSQLSVLSKCYDTINQLSCLSSSAVEHSEALPIDRTLFLVSSLKDKLYEIINTGRWSDVDENICKAFTVATFLEAFFRVNSETVHWSIEKVLYDLDLGLMLGCPLSGSDNKLLTESIRIIEENCSSSCGSSGATKKPKLDYPDVPVAARRTVAEQEHASIAILQRPSIEYFHINHFKLLTPALIQDCMDHWPAINNWKQSDYLSSIAGERTVPVEIGSHYTNENWSQDLVKFKDFLNRQITTAEPCDRVEYLAQHNLFEQIPALRKDILIPEYCCVGTSNESVDIKAWLGPKGTISPMHYDPKHNLLCQVFGHKKIILAAPEDTPNLYPHETEMLKNTSQIDAEHIDTEKFPKCSAVKFFHLHLYEGEMLYIPPQWWHYVRSLEKSFSVSFWWD
ncbi:hypothetical protein HA402_013618 [Bradysia odoriphaga]|nr:hypothetical protein HA402_013618 [Bradysia odoriphaga]